MLHYSKKFRFPYLGVQAEQFKKIHAFVYESGLFDYTDIVDVDINAVEEAFDYLTDTERADLLLDLLDIFSSVYPIEKDAQDWECAVVTVRLVNETAKKYGMDEFDYHTIRAWFLGVALDYEPTYF